MQCNCRCIEAPASSFAAIHSKKTQHIYKTNKRTIIIVYSVVYHSHNLYHIWFYVNTWPEHSSECWSFRNVPVCMCGECIKMMSFCCILWKGYKGEFGTSIMIILEQVTDIATVFSLYQVVTSFGWRSYKRFIKLYERYFISAIWLVVLKGLNLTRKCKRPLFFLNLFIFGFFG